MTEPILGVVIRPLQHFEDDRGTLHRMLRHDDPGFERFGEIYFSGVRQGIVKGWRRHQRITSNLAVPCGSVLLVLFDARPDSPTNGQKMVINTGAHQYALVTIPPGIWSAWKGTGPGISIVANCATEPHDPTETDVASLDSGVVPHDWNQDE